MDKESKLEEYIHLVEFIYNNKYHDSLKLIPFEAFLGRKCNTLVIVLGLENLKEIEKWILKIKQNLKVV